MAAKVLQKMAAGGQQLKQVQIPPGAARPFAQSAVQTDHKARAGVFLRQAGGHNAHHALVPLVPSQYNDPLLWFYVQMLDTLLKDFSLNALAFPVQFAQLQSQLLRPLGVAGEKQLHRHLSHSHPTRGVDPGGQGIAHRDRGDRFILQPGAPDQGRQAQPLGWVQPAQPQADNGPVRPRHRHYIRHRSHRGQVAKFLKNRLGLPLSRHRHSQHQGHSHSSQSFKGIGTVRPVGVHHRGGRGQFLLAGMVIGDDHINAQFTGQFCFFHGGDAAVHCDNQRNPLSRQMDHRLRVQAVPLPKPAGNIGDHMSPPGGEELGEQTGGGDPIHIIVPIDGNELPPLQGQPHPGRRPVHIPQKCRRGNGLPLRRENPAGFAQVFHPTGGQQPGQQWGQPRRLQDLLALRAGRGHAPVFILQLRSPPLHLFLILSAFPYGMRHDKHLNLSIISQERDPFQDKILTSHPSCYKMNANLGFRRQPAGGDPPGRYADGPKI